MPESVAVFKEYNLKRHFQTKHGNFGSNLSESKQQQKANDMVKNLKQQQTVFVKQTVIQEAATKASFVLAYKPVKHNKPFSDAEFVKECMLDAVAITCPEVRTKIEAISLSRRTIVRRIGGIAQNLSEQLFEAGKSFEWYSLALDESTDIEYTAQLLVFIRGIDENFEITEELLSLEHLKDTTTGQDLFESVENCLDRSGLPLHKLANITTDGAPPLTGKNVGLIKLLNDKVKREHPLHSVMSFHCIIHQESLCKSVLDLKHVIDPVVRVINFIRARGLNHRQFKRLLDAIESEYSDVLYHSEVRWLSLGNVLRRVWNLREEILLFLEMKQIDCEFSSEIKKPEWICDLAFSVDILDKLNELNGGLYHFSPKFAHFFGTCYNFPPLSSVQIIIILTCCLLCVL